MDVAAFFKSEFAEHDAVARATQGALANSFAELLGACVKSLRGGGKLMLFGNGGSAADAQHLATELTIRYKKNRAAIAALALTTDTSALTAAGNDLGFDQVFARQIEALGRKGDIAIAMSTAGRAITFSGVTVAIGLSAMIFFQGTFLASMGAAGAIVVACNVALNQCAGLIAEADKVSSEEAHKRAVAYLVPGVILQPSGVFAVIRAQEAGASYIIAS